MISASQWVGADQTATKKLARASPVSMISAGRLVPSASCTSTVAVCFETTRDAAGDELETYRRR